MAIAKTKKFLIVLILSSLLLITGCSNSDSTNVNYKEEIGQGYIEGFLYQTTEGEFVFSKEEAAEPVESATIQVTNSDLYTSEDTTLYFTNKDGYFKTNKLQAQEKYIVDIIVEGNDFSWSNEVLIQKNQTTNISNISIMKNWNIIFFISDKSNSLKEWVDRYISTLEEQLLFKNANIFIIHGEFLEEYNEKTGEFEEVSHTNKGYYLTGNGKREFVDYGQQNFGDPSFYREEIKKIINKYPSKKNMVSIFSHGDGWITREYETPNNPYVAAISDDYSPSGERSGLSNDAIDTFELYEIFNGINIDLFDINACGMGEVEVLNDIPNSVKYTITSTSVTYASEMGGLKILEEIQNGELDPQILGEKAVKAYVDDFKNYELPSTKTLYNMDYNRELAKTMNGLSSSLYISLKDASVKEKFLQDVYYYHGLVQTYWNNSADPKDTKSKDLVGIIDYLIEYDDIYGSEVKEKALKVKEVLNNYIVHHGYSTALVDGIVFDKNDNKEEYHYRNSKGISIYLNDSFIYEYEDTWFNDVANWSKVLKILFSN